LSLGTSDKSEYDGPWADLSRTTTLGRCKPVTWASPIDCLEHQPQRHSRYVNKYSVIFGVRQNLMREVLRIFRNL
jgi:hypothetical protein